jgi:HPt (histidine-containing phosphotransfer) domain-containing protein
MDGHLAKPLTANELENALSQWLPPEGAATGAVSLPSPRSQPDASPVDLQRLQRLESELGDGGREMLAGLIETFSTDFQQGLERLATDARTAAWEAVAAEAHRLRSSTLNLAAGELSRACARLEECARGPEPGHAPALIQRLRDDLPRVQAALRAHARRPSPPVLDSAPQPAPITAASESNRVSS